MLRGGGAKLEDGAERGEGRCLVSEHLFDFVVFVANVSLKLKQLFGFFLCVCLQSENKLLLSNSSVALATCSAPLECQACFGFHTNTLVI